MLRKIGFITLVVAAGLFVLSQTRIGSYGSTAWKRVRVGVKNQVPVEFEIERLRNEVAQLVPDMKNNLSAIAEEMVSVQNLREEIETTRANLGQQKKVLAAMAQDLKSGVTTVSYNGRLLPVSRVREKVAYDLAACQRCEQELKTKEQVLEAKERSLDAARERLASMKSQKQELELQIEQMEAEVKTVRLAQTRSKFELDDSRLAHIKASLADLRTRLKVEKTTAEMLGEFSNDPAPVAERAKSSDQVIKEVEAYLGNGSKADDKVAQNPQ